MAGCGSTTLAAPTRWAGCIRSRSTIVRLPISSPSDSTPWPERDWGGFWRFHPWFSYGPDVGLFFGGGVVRYDFGFRKRPYRSRLSSRVGYATEAARFRAELQGDFYRVNSRVHTSLLLRYSGIDVISFFGFGNESTRIDDDEFYRVPQRQYEVTPSVVLPLGPSGSLTVGPTLKYANTELEPGRFITAAQPYGVGKFGQIGAKATAEWDTRDQPAAARRGVRFVAGAACTPRYGTWTRPTASSMARPPRTSRPNTSFGPTLALRAGAKKVWGAYPFFEAAFVGGSDNVRGLRTQRYAGDASVFGSAELRARLGRYYIILPGTFGVFALGDVGRVYLEGESRTPGTPATAAGSGSPPSRRATPSASPSSAATSARPCTCRPASPIERGPATTRSLPRLSRHQGSERVSEGGRRCANSPRSSPYTLPPWCPGVVRGAAVHSSSVGVPSGRDPRTRRPGAPARRMVALKPPSAARRPFRRYAVAVLAAVLVVGVQPLAHRQFGASLDALILVVVGLSTWYGGLGPGLVTLAVSGLGALLTTVRARRLVSYSPPGPMPSSSWPMGCQASRSAA